MTTTPDNPVTLADLAAEIGITEDTLRGFDTTLRREQATVTADEARHILAAWAIAGALLADLAAEGEE